MEIKKLCVVGAGLMGRQIALNSALYGIETTLYDVIPAACDNAEKWADEYLAERVRKGRKTQEEVDATKARFHVIRELKEAVKDVDCVIEAIREVEEIKRNFFKEVDALVGEDVILATNSSAMVSSKFADCVKNPSRLANIHYYNPALVMEFVEVVQGPHTSDETAQALYEFCKKTGKTPIWMKKEIYGFAGNFLILGLQNQAKYLVQNGYCTPQEVDIALEKGFNHKMGIFRMMDMTGLDLELDAMKSRYEESGIKPDMYDQIEQMVKEGKLGRKSGHGFYDYE